LSGAPFTRINGLAIRLRYIDPFAVSSSADAAPRKCGTLTGREASGAVRAYAREAVSGKFVVALNLGHEPADVSIPWHCRILLSTHNDREGERLRTPFRLRGDEGILAVVD